MARADASTRINKLGVRESIAANAPRITYLSAGSCPVLSIEHATENLYLNSDTLVTQDITTVADTYTVSFEGTGTITFSGSYSGSLVGGGDGPFNRVSKTFIATAGTLTSTVTGSVNYAQAENLDYASSYIATAGTSVTRVADAITGAGSQALFSSVNSAGCLYAEIAAHSDDGTDRFISISDGSNANAIRLGFSGSNIFADIKVANIAQATLFNAETVTDYNKVAFKWNENDFALWINGTEVGTDNSGSILPASTLNEIKFSRGDGGSLFYGKTKALYVPEVLTDDELEALTTP